MLEGYEQELREREQERALDELSSRGNAMNTKLKDVIAEYNLQFAALERDIATIYNARAIMDFRSAPDLVVDALMEQEMNMYKQRDLLEAFIDDLVELSMREDKEIASIMNLLGVDKN